MAGNSNLLAAGGWRLAGPQADVDGDTTPLCVGRRYVPAACADNSSSATLDVPAGARVVAARLYVDTTLSPAVGAAAGPPRRSGRRVRVPRELTAPRRACPKSDEGTGRRHDRRRRRCARPCGTSRTTCTTAVPARTRSPTSCSSGPALAALRLVGHRGRLRARPGRPMSSSTSCRRRAAGAVRAAGPCRGTTASRSRADGSVDVPVTGFTVPVGAPGVRQERSTSSPTPSTAAPTTSCSPVQPLGNNADAGRGHRRRVGVVVGDEPACNTTTDDPGRLDLRPRPGGVDQGRPGPTRVPWRRVTAARRRRAPASTWT